MFQGHFHKFSFRECYNFSDRVLFLSMKFNDENQNIRAFSDVLEGITSKIVLGASPQTPYFKHHSYDRLYWYTVFDPLVKVFDMQECQTLNLVST